MKTILRALVIVLLADGLAQARPKISFSDPVPPANGKRVFGQQCPGDPECIEDCGFDLGKLNCKIKYSAGYGWNLFDAEVVLSDGNGNEIDSTDNYLSGKAATNSTAWTGNKLVTCDSTETLTMTVRASQTSGSGTNILFLRATNKLEFVLRCYPCKEATATEGNGNTTVPRSSTAQEVRLGAFVINLDREPHVVNLAAALPPDCILAPIPPSLFLTNGEGREIFLDVTLPPDLPDGTSVDVGLAAIFEDDPASASAATMTIDIVTPLRFVSVEHDATGFLTLGLAGPWNATYYVESCADLSSWELLTSVPAGDGDEVVLVTVPVPPETPTLFLRAYAETVPGLNRPAGLPTGR